MSLTAGSRLGVFEILGPIGAGGMGEVYRAHDPRLDREVAIKVLAPQLARDPDALARFEREAMSVARLSHPNILAIHEFGRDPSASPAQAPLAFVVTELVNGDTLRARLQAGALPPRKAVAYSLQIARGLAAAHARGIVHRDLKPENVMITRDDQVKILDFGLAKAVEMGPAEVTRGAPVATGAGTILGTFGYMAPEQIRGHAVDYRTDMFAFGAVLYEMLSGARAFKGETAADTMTAILTKEPPDLDTSRLSIPPALDRIARRCLEKEPDLRFQSANDLAFALDTLSTSSSTSGAAAVPAPPARRVRVASLLPWVVAGSALVAAAALWLARSGGGAEPRWEQFSQVTEAAGEETSPTISPDGSTVAYAMRVNGRWGIYAQRVGGRNATPIVDDPQRDEGSPAFSPDGASIAFHESDVDGGIFVAGATGESVRRVTDFGFHPAWSPDGTRIAFTTEEIRDPASRQGEATLYVVDAAGGTPRKIVDGDGVQPSWSPSGERIVYWSNTGGQRDIYTVAVPGGARVPVVEDRALDWSPVWSPDGRYIYFSSDRGGSMNLWRIAIDQSTGRVHGAPEPVTTSVGAAAALPSISKDGKRLAFRSRVAAVNPVAIPFDPATNRAGVPVVLDPSNNFRGPTSVSPDGTLIAYHSLGERQEDLFISSVDGSHMRRVTDDAWRDRGPVFTPDGRELIFYSNRDGQWAVWSIRPDGSNLRKIAGDSKGALDPSISPGGDRVVFTTDATVPELYSVPFKNGAAGAPVKLANTMLDTGEVLATAWSPDGTRLAGPMASRTGQPSGVGIYELAAARARQVSADIAPAAAWLADSRRVVYFTKARSELVVVDTVTLARTVVNVRLPGPSLDDVFTVSPDGRTIYYGAARAEADIWIVERR